MRFWDILVSIFALWKKAIISVLPLSIAAAILAGISSYFREWMVSGHHYVGGVLIILVINSLYLIPMISLFAKVGHAHSGDDITVSQALGAGVTRFVKVFLLAVLLIAIMGVFVGMAVLCAVVHQYVLTVLILFAMLLVLPYFSCCMPLVILDNSGILHAVQNSVKLVRHHWGMVTSIMFVVSLVSALPNFFAGLLLGPGGIVLAMAFTLPINISMSVIILNYLKSQGRNTILIDGKTL